MDCEREPNSAHDGYAVKRREVFIDHLPRKISRLCLLNFGLEIYQNQHGCSCEEKGSCHRSLATKVIETMFAHLWA